MRVLALIVISAFCAQLAASQPVYRVDTVAGSLPENENTAATALLVYPTALLSHNGTLYVLEEGRGRLKAIQEDGSISTRFNILASAMAMAMASDGTIHYVLGGPELYSINPDGSFRPAMRPPEGLIQPRSLTGVAIDPHGNVLVTDSRMSRILRIVDGRSVSVVAGLGSRINISSPSVIANDKDGNIYVAREQGGLVSRIAADGTVTVVAGNGQLGRPVAFAPATESPLGRISQMVVSSSGELLLADAYHGVLLKVSTAGLMEVIAEQRGIVGVAIDSSGSVIFSDQGAGKIWRITSEGPTLVAGREQYWGEDSPAIEALFKSPSALALDRSGNLYVADTFNHRIRKVRQDGIIQTVVGTGRPAREGENVPGTEASIICPDRMASFEDNIYFACSSGTSILRLRSGVVETIAGTGAWGYSGDGGPAKEATFSGITGLAADRAGNLFVSDDRVNTIRKIDAAGKISIYAGIAGSNDQTPAESTGLAVGMPLRGPSHLAVSTSGSLIMFESGTRQLLTIDKKEGVITKSINTLFPLGTPADSLAERWCIFPTVSGLAFDKDDNLFVSKGSVVCRLDTQGKSWLVAGSNFFSFAGDGGPATDAAFRGISSLVIDNAGSVFVADRGNHRIRKLSPVSLTDSERQCSFCISRDSKIVMQPSLSEPRT